MSKKTTKILAPEEIVEQFSLKVFNFVKNMVGRQYAEDLTQEIFLRVFKGIKKLQDIEKFDSWLFAICCNLCRDHIRIKMSSQKISSLNSENSVSNEQVFAEKENDPIEIASQKEQIRIFEDALSKIPPEQKEVFLLRVESNLSFKEIAEIQKCSINTSLNRMSYALKNLRKIIKPSFTE